MNPFHEFRLLSILLIGSLIAFNSCLITGCGGDGNSNLSPPSTGSITGIVLKPVGEVAAGAEIFLEFVSDDRTFTTIADEFGNFFFENVPLNGDVVLNAFSDNDLSGSASGILLQEDPDIYITIVLYKPRIGSVEGKVQKETGEGVEDAIVSIHFIETNYATSTLTGSFGTFRFEGLPVDGTFTISSYDPATASIGSRTSFIIEVLPEDEILIVLKQPVLVNEALSNADFATGDFDGWVVEGDAAVVPSSSVFPEEFALWEALYSNTKVNSNSEEILRLKGQTACNPSPFSALVTTAVGTNGQLSQSFIVGPGHDTLFGRIRFVSNEWPDWFGTEYNDSYSVKLITPKGAQLLAAGNLNTSSWGSGVAGFSGVTPPVNVSIDVSSFVGKTLTLLIQVSDVGDEIYDSGVIVSDFMILDRNNKNFFESGTWLSDTKVSTQLGQKVWITVQNINVLGTTIRISSKYGQGQSQNLLPGQKKTFIFSVFGSEPINWTFDISTNSDVFIVNYDVESTWIPGMAPNPCLR